MRSIVNGISAACIVLLSSASSAEPPAVEESQIWVPSLAITSGILVDKASGEVESTLRPSATGSKSLIAPWFGGSLEVMTPAWEPLGGRTRFFVHGGLAANVGAEQDLAKEGSPDTFVPPDVSGVDDDRVVNGQGSTTSKEPTGFQASAGAGLSFTIETGWRRLRIKPSFEYLVERIEVRGRVHRATSADPALGTWNFFVITGNSKEYFHSIGPGLSVEADVARAGPVLIALLASGSAYRVLSDRDVAFSSTDATGTESGSFRYRKDAWSYGAHVGLRFRWAPEF